ncbi:MAG TPA: YbgC/FadM family acyl-CoA thioesterase [Polyangiaceae bacterium LLY-WYZ-15_(1-7)]|nr:thioesterase [Myxococcales bacterium]MAT27485.1 thioesterase [Sandaracinus sp.]HJK94845.1 YbgC/FadM family acyl-CoA thioesterase [Polyangiaceae bacterium LLY-WYZ-15_(1-7)]MBJ70064.1 thioesterase [Sandaracinus sp.]HJL02327.1 YbgC/FadM family acyl-CoA thioesterase [Polyangiaceae bacterium LLY-WYZ-15_(1-7)]
MEPHRLPVQIYYEDTDHSGLVYHANYLKYCERAREHLLGTDELVRLLREDGVGFVVYKAALTYKKGAVFGDTIEIRTTVAKASDYRLAFRQDVYRAPGSEELLVETEIDLVCVDEAGKLVRVPASVLERVAD